MNKKLIVGNWKMNGNLATNEVLIASLLRCHAASDCEMVLCVPHVYLQACAQQLRASAIALGAQDVAAQASGAFTGEVSASMLADVGCRYVLIGHSERRLGHHETDQLLFRKLASALAAGLQPILCVGETASEYAVGATMAVLKLQLRSALLPLPSDALARMVIAYEPVWAIGTGLSASPEVVAKVHAFIRQELTDIVGAEAAIMPVLYGGSMKPDNAAALLALPGVDGGLIGGASLDAAQFSEIARAVPR